MKQRNEIVFGQGGWRNLKTLHIRWSITWPPFSSLFPINDDTVNAIADHMKQYGYDKSQPIILWHDLFHNMDVVIDGNTRVRAAQKAGLPKVWTVMANFPDQATALEYAIHNQRDRRNLTDGDLLRCIKAVDERKPQGQRTDLASSDAKLGKSSEVTAKIVGTSPRKVEKARTLLDYGDEQTKQTVLDGKKSIHAAAKETQEKRKGVRRSKPLPEDQPVDEHFRRALRAFLGAITDAKGSKWKTTSKEAALHHVDVLYDVINIG
ncbi:MAG: hypothetical protein JW883_05260 [Deltaproteobacteria bacterium]|nr:hypothetical protein [Deltaproteobacteria bacterium]